MKLGKSTSEPEERQPLTNVNPEVQLPKTLHDMMIEVVDNCREKGWYDEARSMGDLVALGHSEFTEALEAYRDWQFDDMTLPACIAQGTHPESDSPDSETHLCKPQGVGSEYADVLIRLLDMCARHGIDLEWEYERKAAYNRTRPHKHGGRAL